MAQTTIYGNVNADRTISSGQEFTVAPMLETGMYSITFKPTFATIPTVIVTVCEPYPDYEGFGTLTFNPTTITTQGFAGRLKGPQDHLYDAPFNFIAIGITED